MIAGRDAPTPGEAKNSWLTGTAAWAFVTASQGLLGVEPDYEGLRIDPCIPKSWTGFSVVRRFRTTEYRISVNNPSGINRGVKRLRVDGRDVPGNLIVHQTGKSKVNVEITLEA
jgi:cellobiose phosphorylase